MSALGQIRLIDSTVVYARDLPAMRQFYETVMEFPLLRELSARWIEYRIGTTTLALTVHGRFDDHRQPPACCRCNSPFASRRSRSPTARRPLRRRVSRSSRR